MISLTLSDCGISIPKRIRNKFTMKKDREDCEIIDWATEKGNSTKNVASSGLGLFDIKSNIIEIGSLQIISSYGFWEQKKNGSVKKLPLKSPYSGTLIRMCLYINPISEDFDDIITIEDLTF